MKIRKIMKDNKWLFLGMLLLLCMICGMSFMVTAVTDPLYSQQEALRWQNGEEPFAQVSAFFDEKKGVGTDSISSIRGSMLGKLSEDGYLNSESGNRTWLDAYSGEQKLEIKRKETSMSVTAMGIGGDFFQFHPIPLKSGSYLTKADINGDRVVIDEQVAWELFGSNDVVGMNIQIGNRIYNVAGVTDIPEDKLYTDAYGTNSRIYINFDELKLLSEGAVITCYEAVLPNPITNYAYNVLSEACGIPADSVQEKKEAAFSFRDCEILENSSRFGIVAMYRLFKNGKYRVVKTNGVRYPFWENITRIKEGKVLCLRSVQVVLLLCLVALLLVVGIRAYRVLGPFSWEPIKKLVRRIPRPKLKKKKKQMDPEEEMIGDDSLENAEDELEDVSGE